MAKVLLSLSFLLVFLLVIGSNVDARALTQDQKNNLIQVMRGLREGGLVKKIDVELNEAYVSENIWNALNVEQKEDITVCLAMWCGWKNGSNTYFVKILGWHTGKKLAKYNTVWGFKLY